MDHSKYEYSQNEAFKCDSMLTHYGCKECDFETDLKTILITHIHHACKKTDFDVKNYVCSNCNFTSYSILVWSRHQGNCTPKCDDKRQEQYKILKCKFCEYKSSTHIGLKEHYINHHSDEIYKCKRCSFTTTKAYFLKKHYNIQHSKRKQVHFECQYCPYKTVYKDNLKKHIIVRHTKPEDIKWFECTQCDYKGKIRSALKHHMRNHIVPKRFHCAQRPLKINGKGGEWFYCDECDYKSRREINVRTHIKYNCEMHVCYCLFKTKYQEKFKNHIQNHNIKEIEKERFYKCSQCFFTTDRRPDLRYHCIVKHTDESKIQWLECDQCDYKAKIKRTLHRHVKKKHRGNK